MPDPKLLAVREAEARYATQRLALYRQRVDTGRGDLTRLAELERVAEGANRRLRLEQEGDRAAHSPADPAELAHGRVGGGHA